MESLTEIPHVSHENPSENLIKTIDNNIEFFVKENKSLSANLNQFKIVVEKCAKAVDEIGTFAKNYDFDEQTAGNGYRSFLDISSSAVKKSAKVCSQLIRARRSIFFRADNYAKYKVRRRFRNVSLKACLFIHREIDEWTIIFQNLVKILDALIELHRGKDDGNLFLDAEGYDSILTKTAKAVDKKAFYGKNIGFQFCASIRPMIKFIVVVTASYFNFYFKDRSKPVRVIQFSNAFTKYFLFANKRATKYAHACDRSTTEFCRVSFRL